MSINIEGVAPNSDEAKALAELQAEGHEIEGQEPKVPEPKVDEPKEEEKVEPAKPDGDEPDGDEAKPDRTPRVVEAWKLKVAEDQKDKLAKQVNDLEEKIKTLSVQKTDITQTQKNDIQADIEALAAEANVDKDFLQKFADTIISKVKPSDDLTKTIEELKQKNELQQELGMFSDEFEKDVLPLLKDKNLSDAELSQIKSALQDLAFTETYARVPLREIFQIKESTLGIKPTKRSSESKGVKVRPSDVVDLDNISEEDFAKLTPEQMEQFSSRKSGSWSSNKRS